MNPPAPAAESISLKPNPDPDPLARKMNPTLQLLAGCLLGAALSATAQDAPAPKTFKVAVETNDLARIAVTPPLPADGRVPAGTVLKVAITPAAGQALDSGYYTTPGPWGRAYHEFSSPTFPVAVTQDIGIGASLIDAGALAGFKLIPDVVYAQPGVKKLKYDVFTPDGAKHLPIVVIIHGGGWSSNTEDVMRGLARELVRGGRYVAVSMDYRWIGRGDGDKEPNSMANLVEDVYGGILHIREHALEYGGDPDRVAVTGDSAGGHLSAAAINLIERIGDQGFGVKEGVYEFKPTYLPAGKTVAQARAELLHAVQVAAPSYGVFTGPMLGGRGARSSAAALDAVAPLANIPAAKSRPAPQLLLRGTRDTLIQDAAVQAYADALKAAGQKAEYVQVEGAAHAFFDWKPDAGTKATFAKYGVPNAAKMQAFFDTVFYPK